MIKPRLYSFYAYAKYLQPLTILRGGLYLSGNDTVRGIFTHANIGLCLFRGDTFAKKYLPSSHDIAETLYARIQTDFTKINEPWDEILIASKVQHLQDELYNFETILEDELSKVPLFCCEEDKVGNLSVDKLVIGAHKGYPEETKKHLPITCFEEIDESGRCLVYERPTASGFHILRAIELTVLAYLQAVPGFAMPSLNRQSWGEYINQLNTHNADRKTIDHMKNLKDNHRNPLMHPQDSLSMPEAVSLFAVGQSTIETIIADGLRRGIFK